MSGFSCAQINSAQTRNNVHLRFEHPIENGRYPELVYWFVKPDTLAPGRVEADTAHIAQDTRFDFPFLTERNGIRFTAPESHALVAKIVKDAHANGLRLGMGFMLQSGDLRKTFPLSDDQTVVTTAEGTLDPDGRVMLTAGATMRFAQVKKSEILRVYVFRKTGEGEYASDTLEDVTPRAKGIARVPDSLTGIMDVSLDMGSSYAGKTALVMQQTYVNALDLQSDAYLRWTRDSVAQYADVPLDGTALDEFSYTHLVAHGKQPWRGQFAGAAFAKRFQEATGANLVDTLFSTRYAPADHPDERIRAVNRYWEFLRSGPLRIERLFYEESRKTFGTSTLAGIHDTFHNHLTNDEVWATGINWWNIPRQYGMSDEDLSLPLRMGLLVSSPGNIMYDQFYGFDIHRFADKALRDARYNARLHYHGYNDTGRWGVELGSKPFLDVVNPVEQKIRLLNRFDPAAPKLPLLVVFGMPRLLNWYPNEKDRNEFDVNGSLGIEEKAQAIWASGYRCAVVPSDLIDDGRLHLNGEGLPTIGNHVFRAVVYLYPEYAKPSTLNFLQEFESRGGALMLEGEATRDFEGVGVAAQFQKIASAAKVRGFRIDDLPKLGIARDSLNSQGGELEDGSVILTDLSSLETNTPQAYDLMLSGHRFTGSYQGVFAIKVSGSGYLEKLACGQCTTVFRDGRPLVIPDKPVDLLLLSKGNGEFSAVVDGTAGSNQIRVEK